MKEKRQYKINVRPTVRSNKRRWSTTKGAWKGTPPGTPYSAQTHNCIFLSYARLREEKGRTCSVCERGDQPQARFSEELRYLGTYLTCGPTLCLTSTHRLPLTLTHHIDASIVLEVRSTREPVSHFIDSRAGPKVFASRLGRESGKTKSRSWSTS